MRYIFVLFKNAKIIKTMDDMPRFIMSNDEITLNDNKYLIKEIHIDNGFQKTHVYLEELK